MRTVPPVLHQPTDGQQLPGTSTDFGSSLMRIPHGQSVLSLDSLFQCHEGILVLNLHISNQRNYHTSSVVQNAIESFRETAVPAAQWPPRVDPMGADDDSGGRIKPHPAAQYPKALPCGERPGCLTVDDYLKHQPPFGVVRPQQVAEPADYAVAGKLLLAAAGVLLALVAMYFYNAALRRRRRLAAGRRRLGRSPAIAWAGGEDSDDGAATPRGLDPAVLRALPVVVVAAGEGAGDCAVCLAEVQPGEKARALPPCGHLFHAECIDAWFRGNAACPLCRADVVAPDDDADEAPPELRIDVEVQDGAAAGAAKASRAPAMGRLPSGTDLEKTRQKLFASTRSVSF
jgi:hypothetical protein